MYLLPSYRTLQTILEILEGEITSFTANLLISFYSTRSVKTDSQIASLIPQIIKIQDLEENTNIE